MAALHGWHRGEQLARQKLGLDKISSTTLLYTHIRADIPDQHSSFYCANVQFLPVCILDDTQRPWVSILAARDGNVGYIQYTTHNTLTIDAKLWSGDPFCRYLKTMDTEGGSDLIGGLGVEVSTRKRNKFAGRMTKVETSEDTVQIELVANEAVGHCPKYITLRELLPHPDAFCIVQEDKQHLLQDERLSKDAIAFILGSDTVFLGTTYSALAEDSSLFPSHLGLNHRGGRVGFVRVKPSDGRTVILPDFTGAQYMNSLGNIEATPFASLAFVSFTTGDILYLTGNAKNVHGAEARAIMPLQDTFTEIYVTGYTLVRDALPVRQDPTVEVQPSPYSPPVRLLTEEEQTALPVQVPDRPTALLTRIVVHSPTIATFEWESSTPLRYSPGQTIIMEFSPFMRPPQDRHMPTGDTSLAKEEFIRTWTISNASQLKSRSFSLTMREKPGGKVTGALFDLVRKYSAEHKAEILDNSRPLNLRVNVVGVSGEFVLPPLKPQLPLIMGAKEIKRLYWIAGGIGITPFVAMLAALSELAYSPLVDITLLISAREPDVMLSLISTAIKGKECPPYLSIHLFTKEDISCVYSDLKVTHREGRLDAPFFEDRKVEFRAEDTEIFICGSGSFEESVLSALAGVGADLGRIHREGFAY